MQEEGSTQEEASGLLIQVAADVENNFGGQFCPDIADHFVVLVREAPLNLASPLSGHCPNSDCTQTGTLGHFFPVRFEQICQITVLTVHKCTKHPGKP